MRWSTRAIARFSCIVLGVAVLASSLTIAPGAGAVPVDDPDGEVVAAPYLPPDDGFDWEMASRYQAFGVWNERDSAPVHPGPVETYSNDYVHPAHFDVTFRGCIDQIDFDLDADSQPTARRYVWTFDGAEVAGDACTVEHRFASDGTHDVTLRVLDSVGELVASFDRTIELRDLLIVSLGDSYGSGEGNPDVVQRFDSFGFPAAGADWVDDRCHRTPHAGPYQAAATLERRDPHTSVTFLSFACSGSTLIRESGALDPLDPYADWDPATSNGSGITGPYAGVEPAQPFLPAQIDQMLDAVGDRPVDALVVSGGGNDAGFANIAQVCVLYPGCQDHHVDSGSSRLEDQFLRERQIIAHGYDVLAGQLAEAEAAGAEVRNVYLTEYPDPTSANDADDPCGAILDDVISPVTVGAVLTTLFGPAGTIATVLTGGFRMDADEVVWAREVALPGINETVRQAANRHGWRYVDGVAAGFRGHGYCSEDSWLRHADDSVHLQGPVDERALFGIRSSTQGTLHPTTQGHQVYARRIVSNLTPLLSPPAAVPAGPVITVDESALDRDDEGWVTGRNILEVEAASNAPEGRSPTDNGIARISLRLDGQDFCAGEPWACAGSELVDNQRYHWRILLPSGIHTVEVTATDWYGTPTTEVLEYRVDRTLPADPSLSVAGDRGGALWFRTSATVVVDADDNHDGRETALRVSVDGEVRTVAPGTELVFEEVGHHEVAAWIETASGRRSGTVRRDFYVGRPDLVAVAFPGGIARMTVDGQDPAWIVRTAIGRGDPAFSPDGNRIAYWDEGRIWIADTDGTDQRLLGDDGMLGASSSHLAWSPDGRRLTVYDRYRLRVVDVVTGDAIDLGSYLGEPTWTPDSRSVLATWNDDEHPGLWAFDVATGDAEELAVPDSLVFEPSLSPDGTQIVYVTGTDEDVTSDLVVVDLATGARTLVAGGRGPGDTEYSSPTWTADGDAVLFSKTRDLWTTPLTQLWRVDADGSNGQRLASVDGDVDIDPDVARNLDPDMPAPLVTGPDEYTTDEDLPLVVDAPGVLANDSVPDGTTATLVEGPDPELGTAEVFSDGRIRFVPAPDRSGSAATLTYAVSDGSRPPVEGTVTVHVTPVADAPLARDDTATAESGVATSVAVLANDSDADGDALAIEVVDGPSHGTVSVIDGSVVYTSSPGWSGTDALIYRATDGALASEPATLTIEVIGGVPACTIVGTEGPDRLIGTPQADVICGLGGDDVILGFGGDDLIIAGDGADTVWGMGGRDRLLGGAGRDSLDGGAGRDRLFGGSGPDTLSGGSGIDRYNGGAGRDRAIGVEPGEAVISCELRR